MNEITKQKLQALNNLVILMAKDKDLPRDLQITFEEIEDYIVNYFLLTFLVEGIL